MKIDEASFRDRDGFIFYNENEVYRAVSESYKTSFEFLKTSGLLNELQEKKMLVAHEEVENTFNIDTAAVLRPEKIPFISYPYEWSFYQLKRAALLTLDIQLKALEKGMTLKDASAFNVQFHNAKPIFIDTLSFEKYEEGLPWQAYRQFCQHFLAPLVLQVYGVRDLNKLQALFIDGIPLGLCSKILPYRSKWNLSIHAHIHLNAKYERKYQGDFNIKKKELNLPKAKLVKIIQHLHAIINDFSLPKSKTNWTDYYADNSYNVQNFQEKKDFVKNTLSKINSETVIDTGSNTGVFSELASPLCHQVISFDFDSSVIHNQCKDFAKKHITNIIPLIVDIGTPTPAIGFNNSERKSFIERLQKDSTSLSLALIHHLVLSNNLTFEKISGFYAQFSKHLIIEFVPKNDPQSQRLLITKKDIFDDYTLENFKLQFSKFFKTVSEQRMSDSERILFHFERHYE